MEENKNNELENNQTSDNNSDDINKVIENEEEIKIDETKLFFDSLIDLYGKRQYKKILKLFSLNEENVDKEKEEEEDNKKINEQDWVREYL